MATSISLRPVLAIATGIGIAAALTFGVGGAASAAPEAGPVILGDAAPFAVLGSQTVTNTGPTLVSGSVGVTGGSAITGFTGPPTGGSVVPGSGAIYAGTTEATNAQAAATSAYNVAASQTPTGPTVSQLNGLSLSPGVYRGTTLDLSVGGTLTLAGSANSFWIFQAGSTLTVNSQAKILITGGASACNVFWQVGSSATIGTGAAFQGTVLASASVTAKTNATIVGRLLAQTAAVTLDSNTITAPVGCPALTAPTGSTTYPTITSSTPPAATAGTPYSFTVTASGTPTPTYTATGLPGGLTLDSATGTIAGTPTTPGTSSVTVTASNGTAPADHATYSLVVATPPVAPTSPPTTAPAGTSPAATTAATTASIAATGTEASTGELAATGSDTVAPLSAAALLLAAGVALTIVARRRRIPMHRR